MQGNTDQKNSEYGHFLRSLGFSKLFLIVTNVRQNALHLTKLWELLFTEFFDEVVEICLPKNGFDKLIDWRTF